MIVDLTTMKEIQSVQVPTVKEKMEIALTEVKKIFGINYLHVRNNKEHLYARQVLFYYLHQIKKIHASTISNYFEVKIDFIYCSVQSIRRIEIAKYSTNEK